MTATLTTATAPAVRKGDLATQTLVTGTFVTNWGSATPTVHSATAPCGATATTRLSRTTARRWFAKEQTAVAQKSTRTLYFCRHCSVAAA